MNDAAWIGNAQEVNERGRYFMMMGNYYTDIGDSDRAWECYESATKPSNRSAITDNLIIVGRARLRFCLRTGRSKQALKVRRALDAPRLKIADSTSGRLDERSLFSSSPFMND